MDYFVNSKSSLDVDNLEQQQQKEVKSCSSVVIDRAALVTSIEIEMSDAGNGVSAFNNSKAAQAAFQLEASDKGNLHSTQSASSSGNNIKSR